MANFLRVALSENDKNELEKSKKVSMGSEIEDHLLWKSFKTGSESAFIAIYKQYFQILYNYGRQLTGDKELIKDCIQDTFISLRQSRTKSASSVLSIKAYLLKSIRYKIIKEIKKKNKRINYFKSDAKPLDFQIIPSIEFQITEQQFKEEQSNKINEAVQNLSGRQKEAIYYYFYNDMSYNEIKEVMGFSSTEAARNLIYRALSALRKSI